MKTKSLLIASLMVIIAAVTAVGKDEPRNAGLAIVPVKGTDVFKVIYKSESSNKVKLNVYNADAHLIFSETMNSVDGFIRPLNFKGLADGDYTIELVDATGKRVEKITLSHSLSKKSVHVSKLMNAEGKYLLAVGNTLNEEIFVKIYDSANNLVHSESRKVAGDFAQLYSIKNVSGAVTFEVSDASGTVKTVRF